MKVRKNERVTVAIIAAVCYILVCAFVLTGKESLETGSFQAGQTTTARPASLAW
ncbi:MAG: hypothetical protein ACLSAP_00195 [Oscillospiraceae bacterium]